MTMGGNSTNSKNKKLLKTVLAVLILIIVAIVVALVVIFVNHHTSENNEANTEYVLPEELLGDDLSPVDQVIKETSLMLNDSNVSSEEIESYYDEVIADALKDGDPGFAAKIVIQKMNFISVVENNCESASRYVDSIDLSPYLDKERNFLASYVVSMAIECNNQELQDKWNSILMGGD